MTIGVVVVTYSAEEVIADCLESLVASRGADLRVVVVDNASPDGTVAAVRDWASRPQSQERGERPFEPVPHGPVPLVEDRARAERLAPGEVALLAGDENTGFAGGVNAGLRVLMANPEIDDFWVLNPDCMAAPGTAARLEELAAEGPYGVIGGRVLYCEPGGVIQGDGGRVNGWTGICSPYNLGRMARETPPPDASRMDYVSGAHMLVSRAFLESAGLMPESYFLYYEEVDWCASRGDLPLRFDVEAHVHHHGGASIGSARVDKGPSEVSAYFLNRARRIFMRRHRPLGLPVSMGYATLRGLRALARGQREAGSAALRGTWGLGPSKRVLQRIGRASLPS